MPPGTTGNAHFSRLRIPMIGTACHAYVLSGLLLIPDCAGQRRGDRTVARMRGIRSGVCRPTDER